MCCRRIESVTVGCARVKQIQARRGARPASGAGRRLRLVAAAPRASYAARFDSATAPGGRRRACPRCHQTSSRCWRARRASAGRRCVRRTTDLNAPAVDCGTASSRGGRCSFPRRPRRRPAALITPTLRVRAARRAWQDKLQSPRQRHAPPRLDPRPPRRRQPTAWPGATRSSATSTETWRRFRR